MKDQFHELTFEEFLEEITRQEQFFFQKKAAENEKSYVTELYFRENLESSIKHPFPPMPKNATKENANKASISETKFEKINFSEKLPNDDIALKGKEEKNQRITRKMVGMLLLRTV
ncbi:uncharacterized protein LOC132060619 isoform X2 [Lycium ferocissimum]|uniref:uncharacterized protein LOC132060619 isoform X2 n=1 Tax=Lycium ferocissimum TaxID=112874 RepID=UPI0028160E03|nr:uncharacterized protein LOC132060619 isoform X2 [Lycium ferocissimum]